MKDHFAANHRGMKWSKNIERCNVQMPFQGRLRKYIQIEDTEGQEVEIDIQNDMKMALEQEFQEAMSQSPNTAPKVHSDIRLSTNLY